MIPFPFTVIEFSNQQLILIAIIGILGLILSWLSLKKILEKKWLIACFNSSCACILITISGLLILIFSHLYSYNRLTHEREIAELTIQKIAQQHYAVTLNFPDNKQEQSFEIRGDEWQIDARILKWKYPVLWLGLDSHYQLERISGRYRNIEKERHSIRTVYALHPDINIDLWDWVRENQHYMPLVDALYGSASYLPMRDGAQYQLSITQTGLIARAMNETAKQSVSDWQ